MKNTKQTILENFSKMDIAMLELILDDSKTYQDATKQTFLQKLNEVFNRFKNSNDNSLIPYGGECLSNECNKGCKGYSFVGNNSHDHTDFIFEETETDFKDIYHCSSFKLDNPEIELRQDFPLFVLGDDRADFKPSVEYLAKVQLCEKAYDEIINDDITYIAKDDYTYWLKKHDELYQSFDFRPLFYKSFEKFYSLYNKLNQFSEYLIYENDTGKGNHDFNLFDTDNEKSLLKWLVNYEHVGNKLLLLPVDFSCNEEEIKTGYVKLSNDYKLQIAVRDFKNLIRFKEIFEEHYWVMLDKYNTINESEWNSIKEGTEEFEKSDSLKYHLNKRRLTG